MTSADGAPWPPDVAAALEAVAAAVAGLPPLAALSAPEIRRHYDPVALAWAGPVPGVASREVTVAGRPCLLHEPEGSGGRAPIVHLHGGGWVFLSPATHARACGLIAASARRPVLIPSYPLAPEAPFPAALDAVGEVLAALDRGEVKGLEGVPALSGDSAGANLALAAALAAGPGAVSALGLIYGVYDDDLATPSHGAFGGGDHPLSTEEMRRFWDLYAPGARSWRARPLHGPLDRAPPAVVVVAGRDVLRSEGEALAARLPRAELVLWEGLHHGCLLHEPILPRMAGLVAELARALDRHMEPAGAAS